MMRFANDNFLGIRIFRIISRDAERSRKEHGEEAATESSNHPLEEHSPRTAPGNGTHPDPAHPQPPPLFLLRLLSSLCKLDLLQLWLWESDSQTVFDVLNKLNFYAFKQLSVERPPAPTPTIPVLPSNQNCHLFIRFYLASALPPHLQIISLLNII